MIDRTNGQGFNSMSFVLQKLADILQRIYSFSVGLQFCITGLSSLDLQVVIVYVGVYSKTICTRAQTARYVTCGSG